MKLREAIRHHVAERLDVPEMPTSLTRLAAAGFTPECVFDVGAYHGEFAHLCLSTWQDTNVVCFEPLPDSVQRLRKLADADSRIQVVPGLVGASDQKAVVLHEAETASSVLSENVPQGFSVSTHPMRSLDDVVASKLSHMAPDLLKIDVQGYELEVLRGAQHTLNTIQVVIAELNLIDIHQGGALFAETVQWMNERGWCAYDICELHRRPLDRALWQVDVLFVPLDSPLRSDKRWTAA